MAPLDFHFVMAKIDGYSFIGWKENKSLLETAK